MKYLSFALMALLLAMAGCVGHPKNVTIVQGFEPERYMGKWYEIARLDHSFERGLTNVTAQYSLNPDGTISVINRGYDPANDRWKEAQGSAYLASSPDIGKLRVSFFWPFYGSYNIIELDKGDYGYAMVCGHDHSYLWILARTPQPDPKITNRLIAKAKQLGFNTEELIVVEHDQQP